MATNVQRTTAICDALVNGTSTQAQQLELAEALFTYGPSLTPFAELTNAQKAAIIPQAFRQYGLDKVRQLRESKRPPAIDPTIDYPEGN